MLPIRPALRSASALLLAGTALASCSVGGDDGAGSASCAALLVRDGHTYRGVGGVKRDPATTGRLVDAVIPACDDSGGRRPVEPDAGVRVHELAAVPVGTALLWNGGVYVRDGRTLPPAAQRWFRAPRCTSPGAFSLTADWLGVTGPKQPRFDGDLRPPYRLEVHVVEGPPAYVGATVQVHAVASTEPGLGPRDVKASLWQGGQVVARVTCVHGRFRAVSLRVPPGSARR
jgi:hypothetical protein